MKNDTLEVMKRARSPLAFLFVCALILGVAPTAGADEEMAGQEYNASASWMFPKAKPGYFTGYMALAIDQQPSKGPDMWSMALVMKGPCHQEGEMTECVGKAGGFFDDLQPSQFEVASDWSSARLDIGKRDKRVTLTWAAEGIPWPGFTGSAGGGTDGESGYEYETEGIGIRRDARVDGTMFGRTLGADGLEDASFFRGEYRGTYRTGDRSITIGSVRWLLPVT